MQEDLAWGDAGFLLVQTEEEEGSMIKLIRDFVSLFGAEISLDEDFLVKRGNKYFLLNEELRTTRPEDFFYAGSFLGEKRKREFMPGFELLRLIAEKRANKIVVDKKTGWLFICGRDIFRRGITEVIGSSKEGDHVLVLNRHGECLGFGKVVSDLDKKKSGVVVRNILDIGDFLRREKNVS
jgi:ribosome biogenesis protein Nip4